MNTTIIAHTDPSPTRHQQRNIRSCPKPPPPNQTSTATTGSDATSLETPGPSPCATQEHSTTSASGEPTPEPTSSCSSTNSNPHRQPRHRRTPADSVGDSSGWRDLNPRPLDPQSSALPTCATARRGQCTRPRNGLAIKGAGVRWTWRRLFRSHRYNATSTHRSSRMS